MVHRLRDTHVICYIYICSILSDEFIGIYAYLAVGQFWEVSLWAVFYGFVDYDYCLWGYYWEKSV